jgi:hypothetical protein
MLITTNTQEKKGEKRICKDLFYYGMLLNLHTVVEHYNYNSQNTHTTYLVL